MNKMKILPGLAVAFGLIFAAQVAAQQTEAPYLYIPSTISQEAQAFLRLLPDPSLNPAVPAADDVKAWIAAQQSREAFGLARQKAVVDSLQPTVTAMKLGGVPVLDIKPRTWKDNGKVMVYTHGGAYTFLSAKSTLNSAAWLMGVENILNESRCVC